MHVRRKMCLLLQFLVSMISAAIIILQVHNWYWYYTKGLPSYGNQGIYSFTSSCHPISPRPRHYYVNLIISHMHLWFCITKRQLSCSCKQFIILDYILYQPCRSHSLYMSSDSEQEMLMGIIAGILSAGMSFG